MMPTPKASARTRLALLLAGVVVGASMLMAWTAPAEAGPHSVTPATSTVPITILSTGQTLHLPTNWQSLPVDQLSHYGLHAGIPAPAGYHFVEHAGVGEPPSALASTARRISTSAVVTPDSSSGCNNLICISLTGKGLTVNDWTTYTRRGDGPEECTYAIFYAPPNEVVFTGETLCGDNDFYDYLTDVVFVKNVEVCNTWAVFSGKPCKQVHS